MATPEELEKRFWKALASDRTIMLGLDGVEGGHTRPMTAQVEDQKSPLWFFTSKDHDLVKLLSATHAAIASFASKGHDIFAAVHGSLRQDNDPATIERLWNPFVAAWYKGGKNDPSLALLRLDADRAEIWLNESSIFAGVKLLFGVDPKKDYADKVAKVAL